MRKHYLKAAWRNIRRGRLFSSINIAGMAVCLCSFLLMLVYYNYETSYDRWDKGLDSVYRVSLNADGDVQNTTPSALAPFLARQSPGIIAATSVQNNGSFEVLMSVGDKKIYQDGLIVTDSSFFDVFPYRLRYGSAKTALALPKSIVISETLSRKLFGSADPLGQKIKLFNSIEGVVTGVLETPKGPSSFNVQLVISTPYGPGDISWSNYSYETYVKTSRFSGPGMLDLEINQLYYNERLKAGNPDYHAYQAKPHHDYLFSERFSQLHNFPKFGKSSYQTTLMLLMLAVFLLLIGIINFSTLSLAKSAIRAKEIGVRKVIGAGRKHIIWGVVYEIGLQCLISAVLGILLLLLVFPAFHSYFHVSYSFLNPRECAVLGLQVAASMVVIILLAGLYPAFFLAKYKPNEVMNGRLLGPARKSVFKNALLVVQLSIAAFFIVGSLVINLQMHYMKTRNLGFQGDQVISIRSTQASREENFSKVWARLSRIPGVEFVSKSTSVPGDEYIDTSTYKCRTMGREVRLNSVRVSVDYFKTLGVSSVSGRLFEQGRPEDLDNTAVINETAVKLLGPETAVGSLIYFPHCDSVPYTIIGVVRDFNIQGLQNAVEPSIYTTSNAHCLYEAGGTILAKIGSDNLPETLESIKKAWKEIEPDFPIRYNFLDQNFQRIFQDSEKIGRVVSFFTIISIFISLIGLFALTAFITARKVKEIGIRKVFGASVANVVWLLSREFVRLSVLSVIIALPFCWWATHRWLSAFVYKIRLTWWMYAAGIVLAMLLAVSVVSVQAFRAAKANPAKSLKNE